MKKEKLPFTIKASFTLLLSLLFFGNMSHADSINNQDNLRLSGFGSLVIGQGEDNFQYKFNEQGGENKYNNNWSINPDSRIGVQVDMQLSEDWSSTVQVLSRANDDWEPQLSWGLISWTPSDKVKFRLGRLRLPYYFYSDFADVGYAYPWITPPAQTYFVVVEQLNGLNLLYNFETAGVSHEIEAYLGNIRDNYAGSETEDLNADNTWGIAWQPSWDRYTLRLSYHHSNDTNIISDEAQTLETTLQQIAATTPYPQSLADEATFTGFEAWYAGIALHADFDEFWVILEHNQLRFPKAFYNDHIRTSISVGYHVNESFEVYGLLEDASDMYSLSNSQAIESVSPLLPAGVGAELASGVRSQEIGREIQSYSVGFRWDFEENIALKGQYTYVEDDVNNRETDVIRFAIDVVF